MVGKSSALQKFVKLLRIQLRYDGLAIEIGDGNQKHATQCFRGLCAKIHLHSNVVEVSVVGRKSWVHERDLAFSESLDLRIAEKQRMD
jgi:hypothetical protein